MVDLIDMPCNGQDKGMPNEWVNVSDNSENTQLSFEDIIRRTQEIAVRIFAVNLTRDRFEIPVMKVLVTGLQPYPGEFETERLKKATKHHGGSNKTGNVVPLL